MKRIWIAVVAACGLADSAWAASVSANATSRPNFVVILGEGRGWSSTSTPMDDRVAASRSDLARTPNLDTLAREGMRFSAAYTSLPRCTPARAALFTGRNPAAMHMTFIGEGRNEDAPDPGRKMIPPTCLLELPKETVTIAEFLKGDGYATAHFGKWHVGRVNPSIHGFDESDGPTANGGPENVNEPNPKEAFRLTGHGLAFMEKQTAAHRPFYLQMSHYAGRSEASARPETLAAVRQRAGGANEKNVADAAVEEDMDATIGLVLKKIAELGIASNTYVVYTADHGTPGRNPPLSGGKGSISEGGLRVPLIVRGPGVPTGSVSHVRAIFTDLFPTLAELARVTNSLPAGIEGGSLVPALTRPGQATVRRPHADLVFHYPHYDHDNGGPASAILLGDYKLVLVYETGAVHLYNLANDLGERDDLAPSMPDKAAELKRLLETRLKEMDVQMAKPNPDYDPKATRAGDPGRGRRGGGRKPR